jgi:hypothetical protein
VLDQNVKRTFPTGPFITPIASTVCPGTESHFRTGSSWSCLIDSPPARALRAIPAKAGTNAVAGAGPTALSPPQTDTLRAMLVRATKRGRRPA